MKLRVSDLKRCRLLLESVPEIADRFVPAMREAPGRWPIIAENWDRLCEMMDEESPIWRDAGGSAPKTADLLRSLDGGAKGASVRPN